MLGLEFYTNKYGLRYTISTILGDRNASTRSSLVPTLTYLNNPLTQCSVIHIKTELESYGGTAGEISMSQWRPSLTVCSLVLCEHLDIFCSSGPNSL